MARKRPCRLYVAQASKSFEGMDSNEPLELDLLGKWQFLANHVEYRGNVLFVAAGLGGLKIVKVKD